ncbi:hypothetical protein COTS27_01257 [Spirochaetota bacterium]|nr:hypothetical protein COTS27_01257 [Spirochaetota bacterium]
MKDFDTCSVFEACCVIFNDPSLRVITETPLTGGCIHQTSLITLQGHPTTPLRKIVLKQAQNRHLATDLIAEANSLLALRAVKRSLLKTNHAAALQYLKIPKPYGTSSHHNYLLLEYLAPKTTTTPTQIRSNETYFAAALATLHQFKDWHQITTDKDPELPAALKTHLANLTAQSFGWYENPYLKPHKKFAPPKSKWIDFFKEYRLIPLLNSTYKDNLLPLTLRKKADLLLKHLHQYLPPPSHASIVHGDLWSGNVLTLPDDATALIDPAVHLSHHETDLALSELFGKRPPIFYSTYQKYFPSAPGYASRVPLYNLYHLLNHLHLFGKSYLPSIAHILSTYP